MCLNPYFLESKNMYVRCGKCIECAAAKSREWSWRICFEASQFEKNIMITLTYNEDSKTSDSLVKRDLQLFMKRLRKSIAPQRVRFFACGEYGDRHSRPHFHIILFNFDFDDRYFFKYDKKMTAIYRSPSLEKLWKSGFSSIIDFTEECSLYVSAYLQKSYESPVLSDEQKKLIRSKHPGSLEEADKEIRRRSRKPCFDDGRLKPFIQMSNRPGIGTNAYKSNWLLSNKMYFHGKSVKLPRFYWKIREKEVGKEQAEAERARVTRDESKEAIDFKRIQFNRLRLKIKFGDDVDDFGRLVFAQKKHKK